MSQHSAAPADAPESHSISQSITLHLLPGILSGAVYFVLRAPLQAAGYPSLMALLAAILIVLIPFELGVLLFLGNKRNRRPSLDGIVLYRNPIPSRQYFVFPPVVAIIGLTVLVLFQRFDASLYDRFFAWLPLLDGGLEGGFSKSALLATHGAAIFLGAIIGPITEELYFRGFLLPRMSRFGSWTVLAHAALFALYHTFTIWLSISRTIFMLPLVYAVRRTNLYVGIIAHILINLIGASSAFLFVLNMPS